MKKIHLIISAILVFLCACSKGENIGPITTLSGQWGGQGVEVLATETQVTFNFNCASGIINKKVTMSNYQFLEKGTYMPVTGNIPVNAEPKPPQNVQYEGKIVNDMLTLTIKSDDGKTIIATYTIAKGVVGDVVKCM